MDRKLAAEMAAVRPEVERLVRQLPVATDYRINMHVENLAALIAYHRRESALQPLERPPRASRDELDKLAKALRRLNNAARGVSRTAWRALVTELGMDWQDGQSMADDYGYKRLDGIQLFVLNQSCGLGIWLDPRLLPAVERACKRLDSESWGKTRRAAWLADELALMFKQVTHELPARGRSGPFVRFVESVFDLAEIRNISVADIAVDAAERCRRIHVK